MVYLTPVEYIVATELRAAPTATAQQLSKQCDLPIKVVYRALRSMATVFGLPRQTVTASFRQLLSEQIQQQSLQLIPTAEERRQP